MDRSHSPRLIALPATIAFVLVAAFAFVAGGVLGAGDPPARPSPQPSVPVATPVPTQPGPSAAPDDASDGLDQVDLFNWPGVNYRITVWDETGSLRDAASGKPDREAPIRYGDAELDAIDDDTIQLSWSDLPIERRLQLSIRIDPSDGRYQITLFRPRTEPPTDGVVSDRVLVLHFNEAVPLEDVKVSVIEG